MSHPATLAPNALTTLDTVKEVLGVHGSSQDAALTRYINTASEAIERYCDRRFQRATVVEKVGFMGGQRLLLERTPLVSITSIVVDGVTLDASAYSIQSAAQGTVYRESGWPWSADIVDAMSPYRLPGTERQLATVTYVGGYVLPNDAGTRSLPYDLEQACVDTVVALYRQQGRDKSVQGEAVGGASVQYAQRNPAISGAGGIIPPSALVTLDGYKRVT